MERNKAFETFQPVKEDNLFKQTVYSGNSRLTPKKKQRPKQKNLFLIRSFYTSLTHGSTSQSNASISLRRGDEVFSEGGGEDVPIARHALTLIFTQTFVRYL